MEGPKGKKQLTLNTELLDTKIDGNILTIKAKKTETKNKIFWGLQRSLINNAVIGSRGMRLF